MKADLGWVWPGEWPAGPDSTSTPFMLLPGTFGSSCWYTRVTLALFSFGASARTLPNGRVATSSEQMMSFMECYPSVGFRGSGGCPRAAEPLVEADAAEP